MTRRGFLQSAAIAGAGLAASGLPARAQTAASSTPRLKLGLDNFSLRALGWKAAQLLDYAAAQKLDVVFFSDLKVFESHEASYLRSIKAQADRLGIEIQVGTFSICPLSKSLTRDYGTPAEHLKLALRIAAALGSRIVRCVLGSGEDRLAEGGIERQIEATVQVLRSVREPAIDAGIRFAVENHAGDMQAWELVALIEAAGKEFVGATMDPGNAAWTIEDPMVNLETLAPYALASGIRDTSVWETPDGAHAQWTSIGEGNTYWPGYVSRFAELCPQTPFILEIISQYGRSIPYFKDEFWNVFSKARAHEFARFVAFAKRGKPRLGYFVPPGRNRSEFEREFQKSDLERSIQYCREVLEIGRKT